MSLLKRAEGFEALAAPDNRKSVRNETEHNRRSATQPLSTGKTEKKKTNPLIPPPEKTFTEEDALGRPIISDEEIEQGLRSFAPDEKQVERTMGLLVPATVSTLEHAAKMSIKSGEALSKGNKHQARMYASIAFDTLKDVLERLK